MGVILLLLVLAGGATASRYCVACERRHVARRWHKAAGLRICHRAFMRWSRVELPGPVHPGYYVLHKPRADEDVTGRRIVSRRFRVDTVAFRDAYLLLGQWGWSMAQRLWFQGIVGQLYWSWPIISAATLVGGRSFQEVSESSVMLDILRTLLKMYGSVKVRRGVLVLGGRGLRPLRNPSERRPGSDRYRQLARGGLKWYDACVAIAAELCLSGPGLLRRMLTALMNNPTRGYPGREDYGHIRICRLLIYCVAAKYSDSPEDWALYRRCSAHIASFFSQYNITTHEDALAARDFMRQVVGIPQYSLPDLTAYVCLVTSQRSG